MTNNIIARLRERAGQYDSHGWHSDIELEAADVIERLREALRLCVQAIEEQDALKDEIERLREALLWYAEHCLQGGDDIEGPSGDYGRRARAALDGKDFVDG